VPEPAEASLGFGTLLEWFTEAEANVVALDLDIDTSTPAVDL
jgi:hypothetical protein